MLLPVNLAATSKKKKNLSQYDNAWVSNDACVFGSARASENARVTGSAEVSGNARVYGNARVSDNAHVSGIARVVGSAVVSGNAHVSSDAAIFGNAWVSGDAWIVSRNHIAWFSSVGSEWGTLTAYTTKSGIEVTRGCFRGTLEQFEAAVQKTHKDSKYAKQYMALIEYIKLRFHGIEINEGVA